MWAGVDPPAGTGNHQDCERGCGPCAEAARPDRVRGEELMDAAWAALIAGRPRELQALEELLERSLVELPDGAEMRDSVRRLEILLAATARNLRVLRGQFRKG